MQGTIGHLLQVKALLHRIVRGGGRTVQATLYEQLRTLFIRLETWTLENPGEHPRELREPLAELAGEMLSCEIDVSAEAIRMGRAQAAASYVTFSQKTGLEVNTVLPKLIKGWRGAERSGPVQQILDQTLRKLVSP